MATQTPGGGKRRGRRKGGQLPPPNCRAILLCEKVIKDAFSGTITIVGVLTRINITRFPGLVGPIYVFTQLAHGHGKYAITIEIQDDAEGTVIGRSPPMPLNFSYATEVHDMIIQIPPMPLQHAGRYTVAVLANGTEVAHQSFDTPEEQTDVSGSETKNGV